MNTRLRELIARAPWREAVTYRDTWPHEYVLTEKEGQRELLNAIYARFQDGESVDCRFFRVSNKYLFVGEFKYWFNSQWDGFDQMMVRTSSTAPVSTETAATSSFSRGTPASPGTTSIQPGPSEAKG